MNFFIFMKFSRKKFGQIIIWRFPPHLWSWCPLWEILDVPLLVPHYPMDNMKDKYHRSRQNGNETINEEDRKMKKRGLLLKNNGSGWFSNSLNSPGYGLMFFQFCGLVREMWQNIVLSPPPSSRFPGDPGSASEN